MDDEARYYLVQFGKKQELASNKAQEVVRVGRFGPKKFSAIFFRFSDVVPISSYLDKGKTINRHTYIKDCLKLLASCLNEQRPTCGSKNLKFHHDKARTHVHAILKNNLEIQNFIVMDHLPNFSDLAPCYL